MKLYVGSRNYKPAGYTTVDIDPLVGADMLADVTKLRNSIAAESCEEIVAGHVLEHLDWPESFLAIAEFQRALAPGGSLKIAVPDMGLLARMLLNSSASPFHVLGLIYGCGGRQNPLERHRYGFTAGMLVDILEAMGFSEFDWWNSDLTDASNGWIPQAGGEHSALSLNIACRKTGSPAVDPQALYETLAQRPLDDFLALAADQYVREATKPAPEATAPRLYQRIHMQLIEARQRIFFLEDLLTKERSANEAAQAPSPQAVAATDAVDESRTANTCDLPSASSAWSGHGDQAFGHVTYAQFGEDLIFANIFSHLKIASPSYLDFGAHHPLNCSNTALLYRSGARGVNVEANPDLIGAFHEMRPDDVNLNVGVAVKAGRMPFYRIDNWSGRNSFNLSTIEAFLNENRQFEMTDVVMVDVKTASEIVREHFSAQRPLNLLCIDVEGLDFDILASFPFDEFRPEVVCVEAVSGAGADNSEAMSRLMSERGYAPCLRTIGNVVYVEREALKRLR
ncbi:MAG TPA: FkbM family methyltransferase [Methylocystis sp.]|nr:FkbM family methyltransferase [Methylocystis sp.]